ncbi:hypothetical protein [Caudoviricetes sp.]|nr:hypothetical protein [Caudoviricetes sp.]UOF79128.1 hypothetical protein [Caudoviricetes sp.]
MTTNNNFTPITAKVDAGIQEEVRKEITAYNERKTDRYPLSPSTIGKCALKLARDVAHYHGIQEYPRTDRTSKLHRVFKRGETLESSLIDDIEKWTDLKVGLRQQRVHLFDVSFTTYKESQIIDKVLTMPIEGNIDALITDTDGTKILVDFKSKGAYYSAGFGDSIMEFFMGLVQTGLVEERDNKCFFITDVVALNKLLPQDDFVVDYLLQLNAYAFSDWFTAHPVDYVALYYENKNTCENYELRWVPDKLLFKYAKEKLQYIFETTMAEGPEAVKREFDFGSARCRLCEYNELCWGKNPGKTSDKVMASASEFENVTEAYNTYKEGLNQEAVKNKAEQEILLLMGEKGITHMQMPDGLNYERRFFKSPKPHYELRLVK